MKWWIVKIKINFTLLKWGGVFIVFIVLRQNKKYILLLF